MAGEVRADEPGAARDEHLHEVGTSDLSFRYAARPSSQDGSSIGCSRSLTSTENGGRGALRSSMSLVDDITWQLDPACLKISTANSYHEQRPPPAMWWMPWNSLSSSRTRPSARWPV